MATKILGIRGDSVCVVYCGGGKGVATPCKLLWSGLTLKT